MTASKKTPRKSNRKTRSSKTTSKITQDEIHDSDATPQQGNCTDNDSIHSKDDTRDAWDDNDLDEAIKEIEGEDFDTDTTNPHSAQANLEKALSGS